MLCFLSRIDIYINTFLYRRFVFIWWYLQPSKRPLAQPETASLRFFDAILKQILLESSFILLLPNDAMQQLFEST